MSNRPEEGRINEEKKGLCICHEGRQRISNCVMIWGSLSGISGQEEASNLPKQVLSPPWTFAGGATKVSRWGLAWPPHATWVLPGHNTVNC